MLLFWSVEAFALPPTQHLAKGTVAAVEHDKITLVLARPGKDEPASFTLQEGRTRFRQDGRKAALEQLPVGQNVRLYYKKEMGVWVATEVAWQTGDRPRK